MFKNIITKLCDFLVKELNCRSQFVIRNCSLYTVYVQDPDGTSSDIVIGSYSECKRDYVYYCDAIRKEQYTVKIRKLSSREPLSTYFAKSGRYFFEGGFCGYENPLKGPNWTEVILPESSYEVNKDG